MDVGDCGKTGVLIRKISIEFRTEDLPQRNVFSLCVMSPGSARVRTHTHTHTHTRPFGVFDRRERQENIHATRQGQSTAALSMENPLHPQLLPGLVAMGAGLDLGKP
jgi:hypothetical protein